MAVKEMTHDELERHIDKAYATNISHLVLGATGIGKSDTVKKKAIEISKRLGREFVLWNKLPKKEKYKVRDNPEKYFFLMDIRLAQLDPSDLRGLPALNGQEIVEWKVPLWLHVASLEGAKGFIFFDEINLAPQSIQGAAYQLIYDRELGEVPIQDGVLPIGAGNRLEDKAHVYDLPRPLQNRFTHSTLSIPYINEACDESWGKWAMDNDIDMRVITFLIQRPTLLNPKIKDDANERAFPTPRSWAYVSKLIKGETDLEWIESLASSAVGAGAASEFASTLKFQRNIKLSDILAHPEKAGDIKELDLKYSLISLVADWYAQNGKKDNLEKVLQICNVIQSEFAILLLRWTKAKHKSLFKTHVRSLKSWKPISKKYQKYIIN